jgi:hypothetical protein
LKPCVCWRGQLVFCITAEGRRAPTPPLPGCTAPAPAPLAEPRRGPKAVQLSSRRCTPGRSGMEYPKVQSIPLRAPAAVQPRSRQLADEGQHRARGGSGIGAGAMPHAHVADHYAPRGAVYVDGGHGHGPHLGSHPAPRRVPPDYVVIGGIHQPVHLRPKRGAV